MILFIILIALALMFYSIISWSFVASILYSWFILPVFESAPLLSMSHFMGIIIFMYVFTNNNTLAFIDDEYKDNKNGIIVSMVSPWTLLLMAWIIKSTLM